MSRPSIPAQISHPVATSSYISVTDSTIYSAGGPTAELHSIRQDGGFGEKIQQLQYVSDAEMTKTDRTRKALVGPGRAWRPRWRASVT